LNVSGDSVINQSVATDASPTFVTITGSGLTASKPVFTDGSKALTSSGTVPVDQGGTGQTTYTNGQLLIGNTTGNTLAKATLTAGTGIDIANGTGTITIGGTDATTAAKGIASFNSVDFTVSSGAVSLKDKGITFVSATKQTTDDLATVVGGDTTITLTDESTYTLRATITAKEDGAAVGATYMMVGTFYREAAGNATQIGDTIMLDRMETAGIQGEWDCDFDLSGNDVRIEVTGEDSHTVDWLAVVEIFKVTNA
jgi:hypothetical protein